MFEIGIFFGVIVWDKLTKTAANSRKMPPLGQFFESEDDFWTESKLGSSCFETTDAFFAKICHKMLVCSSFGGRLFLTVNYHFRLLVTGRLLATRCLPTVWEQPKYIEPILVRSSTSNTPNNRSNNALKSDAYLSFESMWSDVIEEEQAQSSETALVSSSGSKNLLLHDSLLLTNPKLAPKNMVLQTYRTFEKCRKASKS